MSDLPPEIEDTTKFKRLAPAPERRVRHLDGKLLEEAGELVTFDSFWRRRFSDGDVIEVSAEIPATTKKG
jgi:Protein of unknown function (DUF2635)